MIATESQRKPVWAPRALFALAVLHMLVAVADPTWVDIVDNGIVGLAGHDDPLLRAESGYTLYFATAGIFLFALADVTARQLRTTGTLPARLGWYVLAAGLLVTIVEFPLTGGWLLVVLGVALVVTDRRRRSFTPERPRRTVGAHEEAARSRG